ncbi:LPXTG cell wall anchor domain-containing protein [Streptococcus equi]|uniref:LPXTG cell wall anchor domain-containing protein n=1 Tax=Streptococcus equi TaxID=1336 RepID=UPI001E3DD94F|nr:LPXTG cell wall anchor domain-containing protein [Streptococcus equi]MCD3445415.1 LPXTG cell wall anchor domain-containing protein [Streptococcus equi subsp. zooepidemicus]
MKKKQLLSALALSTLVLTQAGFVSADEVTPIDPTAPSTEVVVPPTDTAPVTTDTTSSDSGTTLPVDPTTPSTDPSTDNSQGKDTAGDDVVAPDTGTQGKDNAGENLDPQPSPEPQGKDTAGDNVDPNTGNTTVPTTDGGTAQVTPDKTVPTNNTNISADTAHQAGASQVGTTSTVTGQVVQNVSADAPVYTNTGATIVSTQEGKVVLSDGSMVAPESVGAVTNTDNTITITKADGTKATLPHTGDSATGLLSFAGIFLLGITGFIKKRWI